MTVVLIVIIVWLSVVGFVCLLGRAARLADERESAAWSSLLGPQALTRGPWLTAGPVEAVRSSASFEDERGVGSA